MRKKIITRVWNIIFLLMIVQNSLLACKCLYEGVFCESISINQEIVQVVVNNFPYPRLMEVEILDNIHNEISDKVVFVYGSAGFADCTEDVHKFNVNDTLVLALSNARPYQYKGYYCYYLFGCGRNYLRYKNNIVMGEINHSVSRLTMEEFRKTIRTCLDIDVSVEENSVDRELNVYPNPFLDEFHIELKSLDNYEIKVYDVSGAVIDHSSGNSGRIHSINSAHWNKGIYIIRIISKRGIISKKVYKV